ncbi:thiolase domain-containing protein [Pseudonocardia xishanensis]|uniref:Thiolase domain-containing protein n=1 Tax=Pseudonocardia xishanensis TaxID=630995 RepID=A0ABP8RUI4_9PSEU
MTASTGSVVVGAYEHPGRSLPGYTVPRVLREVTDGVLADAGLGLADVDGFFCDSTVPGFGPSDIMGYLGLNCTYAESTDVGGSAYIAYLGHADAAIRAGKCRVALITLAGLPKADPRNFVGRELVPGPAAPFDVVGTVGGHGPVADYALTARRHMYEFGTTAEQLAWIRVAASEHAQHNPDAVFRDPVTVEQVVDSPLIADPIRRLDCCVITDGGGALLVVHPDVARELGRAGARLRGHGEANHNIDTGRVDLTWCGARRSGTQAFAMSGTTPKDIQYLSLYDSYTITVLMQLEDLGFCEKGKGGPFVEGGTLRARGGALPFNTDGGGLCNNHPANRGGMTKVIEAVRQLRGEARPEVQVHGCELALVSGIGGRLSTRHVSATAVLERFSP